MYRGQAASRYHSSGNYGSGRSSFQSITQNIQIPTEAGKFGVTSATREQLSRDQRKSVPGSRNISLDFNAYRQGSRGGMIVIPDNATEAEVKAAQQYIQGLRNLAEKHGLGDYKIHGKGQYGPGIKTRSENGRGIGGFFHTEPGFNTDPKFKKMMSDPKIRQDYIDMMSRTLGNIPGARFIAPHNTKGNQGAVMTLNDGQTMSETQLARQYLLPGLADIRNRKDALERAKKLGITPPGKDFGKSVAIEGNKVNPTSQRNFLIKELSKSKLIGHVPKDGAKYGITKGTPEEWANYMMRLGSVESSLVTTTHGDKGRFGSGSRGIYQLSQNDAARHGLNNGKPFTLEQLENPEINTRSAIKIHENLLLGNDKTPTKWVPRSTMRESVGRYWGPVSRGWTPDGTERDKKLFEKYGADWAAQDAARQQAALSKSPSLSPNKTVAAIKKKSAAQQIHEFANQKTFVPLKGSVNQLQMKKAAVRKQKISSKLQKVLDYASAQAGVEVDIWSGGQPGIGSGLPRVGSTRHDHGNAADLDLYVTENGQRRKLSSKNPKDRLKIAEFIKHSAAAGAGGIGTGQGYMGDGRIHVGFGKPATWGGGMTGDYKHAWRQGMKLQGKVNVEEGSKGGEPVRPSWAEAQDKMNQIRKASGPEFSPPAVTGAEQPKINMVPPMKLGGPKPEMGPGNITKEEISRRIAEDVPRPVEKPKVVVEPPKDAAAAAIASADVEAKADVETKKQDEVRTETAEKAKAESETPRTKGGHRRPSSAGRFPRNDPESQPASEGSGGYGSFGRCFV